MSTMRRALAGMLLALGLGIGMGAPADAQEIPTGAARVIEKIDYRITVAKIQLDVHIGRILENNAGAIPGE